MFQNIIFYFTDTPGKMAHISEKSIQNANLDNSLDVTELKVNSKKSNETGSDDVKERAKLAFQRSKQFLKAKKSAQKILQNVENVSSEVKEITLNGSHYLNLAPDKAANQFCSQNSDSSTYDELENLEKLFKEELDAIEQNQDFKNLTKSKFGSHQSDVICKKKSQKTNKTDVIKIKEDVITKKQINLAGALKMVDGDLKIHPYLSKDNSQLTVNMRTHTNDIEKNSVDKCYYCGKDFELHSSVCTSKENLYEKPKQILQTENFTTKMDNEETENDFFDIEIKEEIMDFYNPITKTLSEEEFHSKSANASVKSPIETINVQHFRKISDKNDMSLKNIKIFPLVHCHICQKTLKGVSQFSDNSYLCVSCTMKKCHFCDKTFVSINSLCDHIRILHKDVKNKYKFKKCVSFFNSIYVLKTPIKSKLQILKNNTLFEVSKDKIFGSITLEL